MPATASIHQFLHAAHVPYSVRPHKPAYTAQEEAAAARVRSRDWAKVVVCVIDGKPVQAVVPAMMMVDLGRLAGLAGGREIRLASEQEIGRLFRDCEVGAMPPFGPLYGQQVYVDATLAAEAEIAFNAGNHLDAIAMRWDDFARTVRPIIGFFAERR
jgi:Ala-tRNA(Pro) deacylase